METKESLKFVSKDQKLVFQILWKCPQILGLLGLSKIKIYRKINNILNNRENSC